MYSFNYIGCVPFTAAKLTKGGWFSILVSSLSKALNTLGNLSKEMFHGTVAAFTFG